MFKPTIQNAKFIFMALIVICLLGGQSTLLAQTKFLANFDNNGQVNQGQLGPSNLIAQGWIFRVQGASAPVQGFVDGFTNFFTPEQGPGYLASFAVTQSDGTYSTWAILPTISGQAAGDPLTLWVEALDDGSATLEARYSPSGGTNTGSSATDVGDFTTSYCPFGQSPSGAGNRYRLDFLGRGASPFVSRVSSSSILRPTSGLIHSVSAMSRHLPVIFLPFLVQGRRPPGR